jgi:LPS-assembly protein
LSIRIGALTLLLAGLVGAGLPGVAFAQAPGPPPASPQVPVTVGTAAGDATILADRLEEVGPDGLLVATGSVEVIHKAVRLLADRVEVNRQTGDAVAQGRVVFYDGEDQLTGARIEYNMRTGTGRVFQSTGRAAPYFRFSGEQADRLGESVYRVRGGVFTTCEDDPPAWSFRFGEATADLNEYVYGTNASFWVKNLPLIPFVPFFAAAIRRERQTGFLFPRLGSSNRLGVYAEVPFYWAISDSQDATLAPIVYERRGFGLSGEYRYVLSGDNAGTLRGFGLYESQRRDDLRGVYTARHDWATAPGLQFKAHINGVSDDDVLREYGDRLEQRGTQRVESNVFLTRTWESWSLVGNLFWYQDLTTDRPVELQRLPEVALRGMRQPVPGVPGLLWELDASAIHFVRDVGSDGTRADVHPRLSRPFTPGGAVTVTPFVGGRLTAYDRTVVGVRRTREVNEPVEVTEDDARVRRLVEAGADVETKLSRAYAADGVWGLDRLLHTVEPRVNYLWLDGTDLGRLPQWTAADDQIPRTSRVGYSLTNRIRARTISTPDGQPVRWELLRLVLGHSWDLKRDEPGDATGTLIVHPSERLRLRADVTHGVQGEGVKSATADITARLPLATVSLGTRYSDAARFSFLTGSVTSELTSWATLSASTNWDVRRDVFVDSRVAVDFKFQCWAITIEYVHRERRDDEIRFAVSLLGVGGPIRTSVGLGTLDSAGQK